MGAIASRQRRRTGPSGLQGMVLFLALLLALVGCSPNEGTTDDATPATGEAETDADDTTAGADDPTEVTYRPKLLAYLDYSGPFAARGEPLENLHRLYIDWFNETRGADLGIEVQYEAFDTAYDAGRTVDIHSRAVTEENVVGIITHGVVNIGAIQERLPTDGVPAIHGGPAYELLTPGTWAFTPLSDFGDYFATALEWWADAVADGDGPVEAAMVTFDATAGQGWADVLRGQDETSEKFDIVLEEFVPLTESDVGVNAGRIFDADPDAVILAGTETLQPLLLDELAARGFDMSRIIHAQHIGLGLLQDMGVSQDLLDGSYEVTSMDYTDTENEAYQIFQERQGDYDTRWAADTILHVPSILILLQAIEKSVAAGVDGQMTGQDMYEQLTTATFSGFGLVADLQLDNEDNPGRGIESVIMLRQQDGEISDVSGRIDLLE